jgi:hypothetical protein
MTFQWPSFVNFLCLLVQVGSGRSKLLFFWREKIVRFSGFQIALQGVNVNMICKTCFNYAGGAWPLLFLLCAILAGGGWRGFEAGIDPMTRVIGSIEQRETNADSMGLG